MVAAPMCLFAEVKIGTVDTQEVFTLMPELKTAQASLEEVNKRYQTEYKSLQDEFNKRLCLKTQALLRISNSAASRN